MAKVIKRPRKNLPGKMTAFKEPSTTTINKNFGKPTAGAGDDKYFSDEDDFEDVSKCRTTTADTTQLLDHEDHTVAEETPTLNVSISTSPVIVTKANPPDPVTTKKRQIKSVPLKQLPTEVELTRKNVGMGISKKHMTEKEKADMKNHVHRVMVLHLQRKNIKRILPDALDSFYSLAHLYLYDNKIEEMSGISSLPQLESLNLALNKIKRIENLENLPNLKTLYLGHNEIEVIEGLEHLANLLELHVENQKLPPKQPLLFCPNSMSAVSRTLKVLNARNNQIETILDMLNMDVLDTLDLSGNSLLEIEECSDVLTSFKQLRVVDLRNNPITKNPKYKEYIFGKVVSLEILDGKQIDFNQKQSLHRLLKRRNMRMAMRKSVSESLRLSTDKEISTRKMPEIRSMPDINYTYEAPDQEFQFSTPINISPPNEHSKVVCIEEVPTELDSSSGSKLQETAYISRTNISLSTSTENDGQEMSEMAKIIFRLSNMTPSTESIPTFSSKAKSQQQFYWNSKGLKTPKMFRESRPLSPLEVDVTSKPSNSEVGSHGKKRGVLLRRPMARKLPARTMGLNGGHQLSPLLEIATPSPDSVKNFQNASSPLQGKTIGMTNRL